MYVHVLYLVELILALDMHEIVTTGRYEWINTMEFKFPSHAVFFYNYVSDIWSYRFYLHKLYKISYMNIKWSH